MARVEISGFDGLQPRTSPTLLATNGAQKANNVKLYSQELRYWRGPVQDSIPSMANIKTLYRLRNGAAHVWLTWQTDVDVVSGPLADTTDFRIYYTGDGVPKHTNWAMAGAGGAAPAAWQPLGLPAPPSAPAVSVGGTGTGTAEDRVYVYTWVNQFGAILEESAPSPASAIATVQLGQTVSVSAIIQPTAANYSWHAIRIYRSVAGDSTTTYEFVAELTISTGSYNDSLTTAQLGGDLPTLGMIPPPANLAGLVSLPNGSLAGFVGNTVYFSEPYMPHAWPNAYALSIPRNIVGLSVYGNNVVACTDGEPYIFSGSLPGQMQPSKIPLLEPCVGKRTIVTDQYGVTYASPNGLVNISDQIREVVTKQLFRRDEWQAIGDGAGPSAMSAAIYDGKYLGTFSSGTHKPTTIVISRDDIPALSYLTWSPAALFVDTQTAEVFYVDSGDGIIYQLDAPSGAAIVYEWMSKRFVFPTAVSFSCLKLDAQYGEDIPTGADAAVVQNQALIDSGKVKGALGSSRLNQFPLEGSAMVTQGLPDFVQLEFITDDGLQVTMAVDSFDIYRIPPFKCRQIEVQISGNINVRSLVVATSVEELLGRP